MWRWSAASSAWRCTTCDLDRRRKKRFRQMLCRSRMLCRRMIGTMMGGGYDDRHGFAVERRRPKRGNDRPVYVGRARESLDRRALIHLPARDPPPLLGAL